MNNCCNCTCKKERKPTLAVFVKPENRHRVLKIDGIRYIPIYGTNSVEAIRGSTLDGYIVIDKVEDFDYILSSFVLPCMYNRGY